jgi:hypothetical protein
MNKIVIIEKFSSILENYFEKNEEINWDEFFLLRMNKEYLFDLERFQTEEEMENNKVYLFLKIRKH